MGGGRTGWWWDWVVVGLGGSLLVYCVLVGQRVPPSVSVLAHTTVC